MSTELATPRPRVGRRPSTTHAELERVAFALFDERGFEATGVDEIAAASGIARRTFFRYYPSKSDLVWGDFDAELDRFRAWFAAAPDDDGLMETVRAAVVAFNDVPPEQHAQHRRRMGLILGVPTLRANSTLRFVQWRAVISEYAALRLGLAPSDLLPNVISHCALGATTAAYEQWLHDDAADLARLLDEALGELAIGFRHHAPGTTS